VSPASAAPEGVRFVEHTADFGLEVEAPSLEECFARAAAGLFSSFAEERLAAGPGERTVEVAFSGHGLEELLVLWLEELLYRADAERLLFTVFQVEAVEGTQLRGRGVGVPAGPRDTPEPPIKGVTRHDLWIRREGDLWRAHVILDV
jgi:SHS2 domain-containing protein